MFRSSLCTVLFALACALPTAAQTPTISVAGEQMRLQSWTVRGGAAGITVVATCDDDNGNGALPSTYRRWWHFELQGIPAATATNLDVRIERLGTSDPILPVWSLSRDGGARFGDYERLPVTAVPAVAGQTHRFSVTIPAGVTDLRLAKWYPYTVRTKDAQLAAIAGHPHVRAIQTLGTSVQGRPIELVQITDQTVPDAGKRRVWVHAGVHPAETPAHYMAVGLIDFLLSGAPLAEALLDRVLFDIVPMANPDGVALGNYRTNASSVNLEEQWTAPYASAVPEIVALRTAIEQRMGTVAAPAANPIDILFNLHGSHGLGFPFHFRHVANPNFDLVTDRSGVIPAVHALEQQWIDALVANSPFVARGTTQNSTLGAPRRPYVESMMHDRWTVASGWTGRPVMAITLEGTYQRGPDGVSWNTAADYRQLGADMVAALADFVGVPRGGSTRSYGSSCGAATLTGSFTTGPDSFTLFGTGTPVAATAVLVLGTGRAALPLPLRSGCDLLTTPFFVGSPTTTSAFGFWSQRLPVPAGGNGLQVNAQLLLLDQAGPPRLTATNGLELLLLR